MVSGAKYLGAILKDDSGLSNTSGLMVAMENMFHTPKAEMDYFMADLSGISYDPHPRSSKRPEDRYFQLTFKATADCLSGSHLTLAAQRFQNAMVRLTTAAPIQDEWIEKEDLLGFLRSLLAKCTVEAVCGKTFAEKYPNFTEDFYEYNAEIPKFLHGLPRFLISRKSWNARERCIATLQDWRKNFTEQDFDGNAMITRRWKHFSEMELSDYAVGCQDLGILWGWVSSPIL